MDLTTKLVLLMALAKAPRVSELRSLNPRTVQWLPDGACIQGNDPAKTQRGGAPRVFFVPTLPNNVALCPVVCLKQYIKTTDTLRITDQQKERLFSAAVRLASRGRSGMSHCPRRWQDGFRHGGETHSNLETLFLSRSGLERHKT